LLAERRGSKSGAIDEEGNVGPIPVVENERTKKLVDIVTDRDLALKVVADGRDPKVTKVEEVMTREVVTCRPEDDLQRALDAMSEHQLRRVPVVDDGNKLVGIIAQADVATRVNQPQKTAETVEGISLSSRR
jgi:CBS domain-containing protein